MDAKPLSTNHIFQMGHLFIENVARTRRYVLLTHSYTNPKVETRFIRSILYKYALVSPFSPPAFSSNVMCGGCGHAASTRHIPRLGRKEQRHQLLPQLAPCRLPRVGESGEDRRAEHTTARREGSERNADIAMWNSRCFVAKCSRKYMQEKHPVCASDAREASFIFLGGEGGQGVSHEPLLFPTR